MSECIVCGVDGSREAGHAAEAGARLARELSSRALLVHVLEPQAERALPLALPAPRRTRRRRRMLKTTVGASGFPAGTQFQLRTGDPTTELIAPAESERAELLVISTGGLGRASPVLLGGTASALMRRSRASCALSRAARATWTSSTSRAT